MQTGKRELEVLLEFSRAANAAATVDDVLCEIARSVRGGLGYDRVGIFLTECAEGEALCGALGTDDTGSDVPISHIKFGLDSDPRWREMIAGKREYLFTEDAHDAIGLTLPRGKPVRHHVVVPLKTPQRLIGGLAVDNGFTDRPIDESRVPTLLALGRQAAVALQNVGLVEELRASEERLRALVTSLQETLYSVRIEGGSVTPLFYSPQVETLTGFTPEEALQTADFWRIVTHPQDRAKVDRAKDELAKGRVVSLEYRVQHRDGTTRWVLDTPVPVESVGPATVVNGTILDITDRKELEDRLRRAQRMETIGTLASGVAHNFNNYLQMVIMQITHAQFELDDAHPAVGFLKQAQDTLDTASALARRLIKFGNKSEGERQEARLDEIVERSLPLITPSLSKEIKVEHLPDPDAAAVMADIDQIQQILVNLCINARDAMGGRGVITIRCQNVLVTEQDRRRTAGFPPGEYVRLQVHDTGPGMDAATQERIFEPFFTTKPFGQGTGLGLAVTYTIVTDHGGWIDVESEPGKGTVFSVYLPSAETVRKGANVDAGLPANRIMLVVDPEERDREQLAGLLESLGVDVMTAEGVSDAMAVIWDAGEQLDAVICSARLGSVDLMQLADNLHGNGTKPRLVVSGERGEMTGRAGGSAAASLPVLTRPFSPPKVAETLGIPYIADKPVRHGERQRRPLRSRPRR